MSTFTTAFQIAVPIVFLIIFSISFLIKKSKN